MKLASSLISTGLSSQSISIFYSWVIWNPPIPICKLSYWILYICNMQNFQRCSFLSLLFYLILSRFTLFPRNLSWYRMSVSPIPPLSTGTGNLFPDSSTHAPCDFQPYPARYARHLPHAGKAFRFFPDPSSWAVDNSLCEIIFARKEEEWVEGSPRKAATFDGGTENILAWFLHAAAVSGDLEGGFDYFPPSAHGFYPKR